MAAQEALIRRFCQFPLCGKELEGRQRMYCGRAHLDKDRGRRRREERDEMLRRTQDLAEEALRLVNRIRGKRRKREEG